MKFNSFAGGIYSSSALHGFDATVASICVWKEFDSANETMQVLCWKDALVWNVRSFLVGLDRFVVKEEGTLAQGLCRVSRTANFDLSEYFSWRWDGAKYLEMIGAGMAQVTAEEDNQTYDLTQLMLLGLMNENHSVPAVPIIYDVAKKSLLQLVNWDMQNCCMFSELFHPVCFLYYRSVSHCVIV